MTNTRKALEMAIEALSQNEGWFEPEAAIQACKEALEQPAQEYLTRAQQVIRANNSAQEPVAWINESEDIVTSNEEFTVGWTPLYTHPAPQPAQEPVGWISVKNKLPREFQKVIVYVNRFNYCPNYLDTSTIQDGKWTSNNGNAMEITHWMPFPKAPNETNTHPAPSNGMDKPLFARVVPWQGLSQEEQWNLINRSDIPADYDHEILAIAHAIEQSLKEKNHG